jgi:cephalosporin-C deacetylase-like acetyl esterase
MRIPISIAVIASFLWTSSAAAQTLPGTASLEPGKDWARVMLDGIHRYLDRETVESVKHRNAGFVPNTASDEEYERALIPKRERLRQLIGAVDVRVSQPRFLSTTPIADWKSTGTIAVHAVRWPAFAGVHGEGLLLEPFPSPKDAAAAIVVIPDADQSPEQLAGLAAGLLPTSQVARILAERGCRVLVPALIDRRDTHSGSALADRWTNQSHREFIWRMAYQMGRHPIGYEVQRVLAGVDALLRDNPAARVGVFGHGEGGLIALHAAAIDPRIQATVVSGHFGPRERLADEPIERDVWNLHREFGDAELLRMVVPRTLVIETAEPPRIVPHPTKGRRATAAPGRIPQPMREVIDAEIARGLAGLPDRFRSSVHVRPAAKEGNTSFGAGATVLLTKLLAEAKAPTNAVHDAKRYDIAFPLTASFNADRQKRLFDELVDHTQKLQAPAVKNRQEHVWSKLKLNDVESFQKSQEPLRKQFWEETIGKLPEPVKDMKPRTRLILETPKWKGYEVVLDVLDNVISYGILLVPNDIKPGERRPCVVCQHGLEGRPMDVVNPNERTKYYNSFGAQLADHGFVVFAPQAPYIFQNDFRQAVRKMHPLGLTIYAFIVRQHEQILNFLETLPFVDAGRIAYYGLSYGGKVAVRIPACLVRYCAVICSGDFNEWIWKNITLDWAGSYMFTGEYEMFEFNLGNTFNYSEMTALIAPRPFMVERGHDDGVGLDEYVAFEYAKTRRLYDRLKIGDRTEIEFFSGGHEIHGRGTFEFLRRHLRWPSSRESK